MLGLWWHNIILSNESIIALKINNVAGHFTVNQCFIHDNYVRDMGEEYKDGP